MPCADQVPIKLPHLTMLRPKWSAGRAAPRYRSARTSRSAKLGQHPISGVLDDPATVFGIFGIDKTAQMGLKLDVRALFVHTGSADIGCQYGSKPAFDAVLTRDSHALISTETPYLASYRKRAVCKDWVVVCAVRCEPVSDPKFPAKGRFAGNFPRNTRFCPKARVCCAVISKA